MTILCYHAVDPDWCSPMAIHPRDFERHCAWLAARRAVLPLPDALTSADAAFRLPRGCVALTFDDGFSSLYRHAWPLLARHRLPATVFLVAATLAPGGQEVDWVATAPPWRLTTLDAGQVGEMRKAGVTFGSHSLHHADLTELGFEQCVTDLRTSRELLEGVLGCPVRLLAYPRGRHDAQVRAAAAAAGYSYAFALPERRETPDRYAVPRVGVHRGNGVATLATKTSAPYLRLRTSPGYPLLQHAARIARRGAA